MTVGLSLLASVLEAKDLSSYYSLSLDERFFFGEELALYKLIQKHVLNYHTLPDASTVTSSFGPLVKAPEPPKYYLDQVEERYSHRRLNSALSECNGLLKEQDVWTATNVLSETLSDIKRIKNRNALLDFSADGLDHFSSSLLEKLSDDGSGAVYTGWSKVDAGGGLKGGDILSIIGRPGMGKTYSLLHMADRIMQEQNRRVLLVSMEVKLPELADRITAVHSHVHAGHVKIGDLSSTEKAKIEQSLLELQSNDGRLWLLDGNLNATVEQIFSFVYQLSPHVLIIDAAYLLKHADRRLNKFQRVDVNLEELKTLSSQYNIPVLLSYQFNREGQKKMNKSKDKDKEEAKLEDIAHSDTVGQISSIVLGLFDRDSIETVQSRKVTVLKGRNGETGEFQIWWDFNKMDFSEMPDQGVLLESLKFT